MLWNYALVCIIAWSGLVQSAKVSENEISRHVIDNCPYLASNMRPVDDVSQPVYANFSLYAIRFQGIDDTEQK